MNDRDRLLLLTRIAFLNAIILSFLAVQFVISPIYIVFLVLIPVTFGLQIYHASLGKAALSFILVITLAFLLFGIVVGYWALIYAIIGCGLGLARKYRLPYWLRLPMISTTYFLSITGILYTFGRFANISWDDLMAVISGYLPLEGVQIFSMLSIGLFFWSLLNTIGSEQLISRVLRSIYPSSNQ